MTTLAATKRGRTRARGDAKEGRLRAATWCLHVAVTLLAVISLLTNRFEIWIDLRWMKEGAILLEILWVGASVMVPWLTGPRLAWFKGRGWKQSGWMPAWGLWLLWPSYAMLACLVANTVAYVRLWWSEQVDRMVPLPLVAAVVIGAWVLLTREWVRRGAGLAGRQEYARASRVTHLRGGIYAVGMVILLAPFFLVHVYSRPVTGDVDLAVVLGAAVRRDGTATQTLADRTRVAIDLYKRGLVSHIMLSGAISPPERPGDPDPNEVVAMKRVCLDERVPEEALELDPVGVNTRATAYNARALMQARGYKTVVACSTDSHLLRVARAFEEVGIEAYTMPSQPEGWRCASTEATMRELVGLVIYTLDPHYREPKAAIMHLHNPRVRVKKTAGALEVFDGDALVKSYPCITGGNTGDKETEGDRKTPLGMFHIVFKNPESKFHLSLGLDYPNREDAERGLATGLITRKEHDDILAALSSDLTKDVNQKKLWYTKLGGEIFIHGNGQGRTGTAGCVAVSNDDVEELYAILPLGTPVEILP